MKLLTEPSLKFRVENFKRKTNWPATSVMQDISRTLISRKSFDEVFDERRTKHVVEPVDLHAMMAFVKHVFASTQFGKGQYSGLIRKRMISAGALHPLDVVIVDGPAIEDPVIFADNSNKFFTLEILHQTTFYEAVSDAKLILPNAEGHMFLFAGDKNRVSDVYNAPESLLWRDAGAVMQACSMAAFAYGYAFCPLGYTGGAILSALGPPHKNYIALGLGVFGR